MNKLALVLLVVLGGVASADDTKKCDPFGDMHTCSPEAIAQAAKQPAVKQPAVKQRKQPAVEHAVVTSTSCDPFNAMHGCSQVAQADTKPPADPPAEPERRPAPPPVGNAHQACVDAMNADPAFATSILAIADKQIDQKTVAAHQDADYHIQKNEKHVFLAYGAMWVIAALFVLFLWMRQQKLLREIAGLKRDLEVAAAGDAKK